jgi:hypothetical protein
MRILLAIGCNDYTFVNNLNSAVFDANGVFAGLVGNEEHQYHPEYSKLLLSPTAADFRSELSDVLYVVPEVAVFTFFFAGHAAVFDETLYLAFRDTRPDRISSTAVGFPEILRAVAGARPKQANFVLDACNAGGLGFDIGSILKRTIVGNSDTIGISFVAATAAEQLAHETEVGGQFTNEFQKIIKGETFVQQAKPFLNLAEIAQQIQNSGATKGQNISYWSLNIQGPNLFAKNRHFSGPAYVTDAIVSQLQQHKIESAKLGAEFKSSLARVKNGIRERSFSKTINSVFSQIDEAQKLSMIYGLAEGLKTELAESQDAFLENRVYSVFLGQILSLAPTDDRRWVIRNLMDWFVAASRRALSVLDEAMKLDRNALLVDTISDFYELPIRISDIFGQCALFISSQDHPCESDVGLVRKIIEKILQRYGNSVLALSDDQATGYLLALELCRRYSWIETSEEIIGRLYHDLHKNFGRVGDYALNAERRYTLLSERYVHSLNMTRDLYSAPSDLTTVILSFSALSLLDDVIDPTLIEIDHTNINFFVPDGFASFGLNAAIPGNNITLTLGHDFWSCIDLRRILRNDILTAFYSSSSAMGCEDLFCTLASALALKDRLPWHYVERPQAEVLIDTRKE